MHTPPSSEPSVRDPVDGWEGTSRSRRWLRRGVLLLALAVASLVLVGLTFGGSSRDANAASPQLRAWWGLRNLMLGPPRIGIQIGHWQAEQQPDELAALRWNTGGRAAGLDEVAVNRAVAEALAVQLEARGVRVDLLPATIPPRYRADAFISIHADSSPDPERRGYKSAHFEPARNGREARFKAFVDAAYLRLSGLPGDDANTTANMFNYYGFNTRRYRHSVSRNTPSVLVELGYLSHAEDREYLLESAAPSGALAKGIVAYLVAIGRLPIP